MRRTLTVSLLALVCSTGLYAQAVVGAGAITGLVRDMYGDGIPDSTVTLTNKTNGVKRTMETSDDGIFDAPGLVPASDYTIKVVRKGYADWELPSFFLSVGETLNFKITLYADKADSPEEAVRSLSPVQDNKTSVAALVNDDQLVNLPTFNRRLDSLILLAPSVTQGNSGILAFRGEPFTNAFLVDGIDTTNRYFLSNVGIAPFLSQDATSQMQVVSGAAPAEFGHSAGGFVNLVTRTGGNAFHFGGYDYYSKNNWAAPDYFANGYKPAGRRNHAGVNVSLPIESDTLFLYGNAERLSSSSEGINRISNPLLVNTAGTSILSSTCTATPSQCDAATSFLAAQLNAKVPMSNNSTSAFVRLDFRPHDIDSFTASAAILGSRGRNSANNATVAADGGLRGSNATLQNTTRFANLGWTHVLNGKMVNEFRGFWFRQTLDATTDSALYPSGTGPVAISIAGTQVGANPKFPFNLREQRYGGTDSFTWTLASHTIKLGGDVARDEDTMSQLFAQYGAYDYASLSKFALDFTANVRQVKNWSLYRQTLGNNLTDTQTIHFSGYAQDTWKVFPFLVVNAGIRYDKERLPHPYGTNLGTYNSRFIPSPNTNVMPRLGLAFMIDKRTVLRIGGGSYYQPFSGQLLRDLYSGGGVYQSNYHLSPTAVGAPAFRNTIATTSTLASNLITQFFTATRFRNPYTIQGSAALERRLNRWVSLAASYMITNGVKMWSAYDRNVPGGPATYLTYSVTSPANGSVSTYSTPIWTALVGPKYQVDNGASSKYKGASAQIRTAPLFGLTAQASYTWSKATDDFGGPPVYSIVASNVDAGGYATDAGPSAFDQRHRLVVNWNWQPVFTKSNNAAARFVVNGWQISGIGTYGSTMFATPTVQVVGQQFSGTVASFPNTLNGTGGWSRVPFQGVNSLPIGAHSSLDARVSKALPFTDRLRGQVSVEAYNALNHVNYTSVNTIAFQAISGTLRPVAGVGNPTSTYGPVTGSGARRVQVSLRVDF